MASADNLCLSLFTSLHRCARTGKLALLSAIVVASVLLVPVDGRAQSGERDLVEFMTGRKLTGKVKAIRKMEKEFDFTYELSGREFTRTFKFSSVRAVTMDGNRHVLTRESATAVESATGGKPRGQNRRSIALSQTPLQRSPTGLIRRQSISRGR